jgi:hypothetical protein
VLPPVVGAPAVLISDADEFDSSLCIADRPFGSTRKGLACPTPLVGITLHALSSANAGIS